MARLTRAALKQIAQRILDDECDPVVRLRLRRDVLGLRVSQRDLFTNAWVKLLASEQHRDGSWGRFHSAERTGNRTFATTEGAVSRGLEFGLDRTHPIFHRAGAYIASILSGRASFPESERNERWPTGARLFAAATLAQISPRHRAIDSTWNLWRDIAAATFSSGRYDSRAELAAHARLTGISKDLRYLQIHNKYAIALLAARADDLSRDLQRALMRSIVSRPGGIRYWPIDFRPRAIVRPPPQALLHPLELINRFSDAGNFVSHVVQLLWTSRNREGLWDFGPRRKWYDPHPLSSPPPTRQKRVQDHSTRVLCVLAKYVS